MGNLDAKRDWGYAKDYVEVGTDAFWFLSICVCMSECQAPPGRAAWRGQRVSHAHAAVSQLTLCPLLAHGHVREAVLAQSEGESLTGVVLIIETRMLASGLDGGQKAHGVASFLECLPRVSPPPSPHPGRRWWRARGPAGEQD